MITKNQVNLGNKPPITETAGPHHGMNSILYWGSTTAMAVLLLTQSGCLASRPLEHVSVTVRGPQEMFVGPEDSLTPVILGYKEKIGLCLEVPADKDTSQWKACLILGEYADPRGYVRPEIRAGRNLYFEMAIPKKLKTAEALQLRGRLIDGFDSSEFHIPGLTVRFEADHVPYQELTESKGELGQAIEERGIEKVLPDLDQLAQVARTMGFPLLASQVTLIAVYYLDQRGTAESLVAARRRLKELPKWLERPESGRRGAQVFLAKGRLEMKPGGNLRQAMIELTEAERRYLKMCDPQTLAAITDQAEIFARVGNVGRGIELLRSGLSDWQERARDIKLIWFSAVSQLGWLVLQNPEAGEEALGEADRHLETLLADISSDIAERANLRINLAHLRVLQGRDPQALLGQARHLLKQMEDDNERARLLSGWADLVEGLQALAMRDPNRCLALCEPLLQQNDPRLIANAWSMVGRSRRLLGDLEKARAAFEWALLYNKTGYAQPFEKKPLSPGERAENIARATRVAMEMGHADRAWELLAGIDRIATDERARRSCREKTDDPELIKQWVENERRSQIFYEELRALQEKFPNEEREMRIRALKKELDLLIRNWPGCPDLVPVKDIVEPDYRAVALEDEILLFHRTPAGEVSLERRTPVNRRELRRLLTTVQEALINRDWDDVRWRRELELPAKALLPQEPSSLGPVTVFGLHGLLQEVPLSALPLPQPGNDPQPTGPRWFGEVTVVALQPAGVRDEPPPSGNAEPTPLFVVDPTKDLGPGLLYRYRNLFPQGRFLHREEVTRRAFSRFLAHASFLHVDAHGHHDPAFPELAGIELNDGIFYLSELEELYLSRPEETMSPPRFVNLSGCQTGRWPVTADSGHYGLAGFFARLGTRWTVGSRGNLDNQLARDFNNKFYEVIGKGGSVPSAYGEASAGVRRQYSATLWATLLLVRGPGSSETNNQN